MSLPGPGFAVGLQSGGVLGRAQQAAAVERVGDRARAVISLGLERAVPAAEHIRPGRDFIAGRDHPRDDAGGFAFATACGAAGRVARDGPSRTPLSALLGGVSVSSLEIPNRLHVAGPTTPSTVSPWRACSRRIAASVAGPKLPSAGRCSACCSRATAPPPAAASSPWSRCWIRRSRWSACPRRRSRRSRWHGPRG